MTIRRLSFNIPLIQNIVSQRCLRGRTYIFPLKYNKRISVNKTNMSGSKDDGNVNMAIDNPDVPKNRKQFVPIGR